jgi:3-methyl-2-oxobutanoate hydroxymethyltransferase
VLVSYDVLGLTAKSPPFAKKYAQLNTVLTDAARAFVNDVKGGNVSGG